ncbi:MAG: transcription elongation factor GreA [Bacteroidota bacterium]|nr:transcription elongation factor GreA [Bacteroidota bacterium]
MPVYMTPEAIKKLREDLHHARTVQRPKISQDIADARAHGDLSENAEYDAAKDAQGKLEARIAQMEATLGDARVLDEQKVDHTKAYILSTVRVRNLKTDSEHFFKLVSAPEADLSRGRISITSPIGKGLLGRSVGEQAVIDAPAGQIFMEILGISREGA